MRLIDAEPIEKFIENGLNCKDPKKRFGHDAIEILAEVHYAQTIAQQEPNSPLTLEELREMDGEPVWLSFLDINRGESHYVMFYGLDKYGSRAHFYNEISRSLDDYGKTWLAYRRKPEDAHDAT